MHSHRRPRGRILFEAVCALTAGVSFVGAWIQTGAWAFIGPAFIFTLFGLYWAIDLFGQDSPAVAAQPQAAPAPARVADPEPVASSESAVMPEIRFARFEAPAAPAPEPVVDHFDEPEAHTDVVPYVPEPVVAPAPAPLASGDPQPRAKKARAKKGAEPVAAPAPVLTAAEQHDQHIEQLFDPQPFARQARPAFGKRSRGPGGSRPLPA